MKTKITGGTLRIPKNPSKAWRVFLRTLKSQKTPNLPKYRRNSPIKTFKIATVNWVGGYFIEMIVFFLGGKFWIPQTSTKSQGKPNKPPKLWGDVLSSHRSHCWYSWRAISNDDARCLDTWRHPKNIGGEDKEKLERLISNYLMGMWRFKDVWNSLLIWGRFHVFAYSWKWNSCDVFERCGSKTT